MGKPNTVKYCVALVLKLGGVPGEVKHLSTQRKRKKSLFTANISLVAASEKETAQTELYNLLYFSGL